MGPMQPFTSRSEGNETWAGSREVSTECRTFSIFSPCFLFFIVACITETSNAQWPAWLGPNKWLILCHAGPAVTPQTHTTSYARTPHSTYLAFVLLCVSFIPGLVPGPFKQLDTAALMVAPRMPGCSAWQTATPWLGPQHCPATIQRWPRDLFFKHTRRTFHNIVPDVRVVFFPPLLPFCFVFFHLHVVNSVCTVFNLLVWAQGVLVTRSVSQPALLQLCLLPLACVICSCGEGQTMRNG